MYLCKTPVQPYFESDLIAFDFLMIIYCYLFVDQNSILPNTLIIAGKRYILECIKEKCHNYHVQM